jgi:hypothetical protein
VQGRWQLPRRRQRVHQRLPVLQQLLQRRRVLVPAERLRLRARQPVLLGQLQPQHCLRAVAARRGRQLFQSVGPIRVRAGICRRRAKPYIRRVLGDAHGLALEPGHARSVGAAQLAEAAAVRTPGAVERPSVLAEAAEAGRAASTDSARRRAVAARQADLPTREHRGARLARGPVPAPGAALTAMARARCRCRGLADLLVWHGRMHAFTIGADAQEAVVAVERASAVGRRPGG